jgi:hypothetical protein
MALIQNNSIKLKASIRSKNVTLSLGNIFSLLSIKINRNIGPIVCMTLHITSKMINGFIELPNGPEEGQNSLFII